MFVQQVEAQLARLEEEAKALRAQRASIDARLAEIDEKSGEFRVALKVALMLEGSEAAEDPHPTPTDRYDQSVPRGELKAENERSPFYGQSLAVAAASLIQNRGHALSEQEILDGLAAGGVKMISAQPVANLRLALRKRPELVRYQDGKWHVLQDVSTLPAPPSGAVHNRAQETHLQKTMQGLAAARERGVTGGRKPVAPEKRAEVERLLEAGVSPSKVAKATGVGKSSIYNWIAARKPDRSLESSSPEDDQEYPQPPLTRA